MSDRDREDHDASLVAHEEQLRVDKRWEGVGHARFRREVEREKVREDYPRQVERLAHQRVPPAPDDSGKIETLPDGSISVPLFEEELVVTRRSVLRERVIIRKEQVTEWQRVEEELRREHITVDTGDVPEGAVTGLSGSTRGRRSRSRATGPAETRPFFLTSEFAFGVLAILGLLITALVNDSIDARFFWIAATVIAAAYFLSRGLAKADTPESRQR